jgi:hypothetical protein
LPFLEGELIFTTPPCGLAALATVHMEVNKRAVISNRMAHFFALILVPPRS